MTPRREESVQRELTAADLATFCTGVKLMPEAKDNWGVQDFKPTPNHVDKCPPGPQ